jgi:hypothetical protein
MTTSESALMQMQTNTASPFSKFCVDKDGSVYSTINEAKRVIAGLVKPSEFNGKSLPLDVVVSSHLTTFDSVFDDGTTAVFLDRTKIGVIADKLATELSVENAVLEILDIKHSYVVDQADKYISVFTVTANAYVQP